MKNFDSKEIGGGNVGPGVKSFVPKVRPTSATPPIGTGVSGAKISGADKSNKNCKS